MPAPYVLGELPKDTARWSIPYEVRRWFNELKRLAIGLSGSADLNFPNTLAQASSDLTLAVPGATVGDFVEVSAPLAAMAAGTSYEAFVSAVDVVTVRFHNYSAGAINPASGTFTVRVKRG